MYNIFDFKDFYILLLKKNKKENEIKGESILHLFDCDGVIKKTHLFQYRDNNIENHWDNRTPIIKRVLDWTVHVLLFFTYSMQWIFFLNFWTLN